MKQQNNFPYDIPAEYADIVDSSKVNLSDFALFLAVMKHKKAHECVLSIILGYQGLLDSPILKSGKKTKYRHLPSTIVTFITQKDIFGKDRAVYTFTERCHEFPEMELEDGTKKIFLNMTSKNGRDELVSFLQYCKNSTLDNPDIVVLDERLRTLDSIVSEVKQTEEWEVARMSILSTGIEIGEKKGILAMIRMGREFHLSDDAILEQICKSFDLNQITAKKYLDSIEK